MASHCDMDGVLLQLHKQGFTELACNVTGLKANKSECIPDVLQHQQRYIRLPGSVTATFSGELRYDAALAQDHVVPMRVSLDLVQAPSCFCLPVLQKRSLDPPFHVRMRWRSSLPLQFAVTVAAFVVDESALPSMLSWQLPSTADAAKALLEHQQERVVVLSPVDGMKAEAAGDVAGECTHAAEAVFNFSKLQFGQPSQMRPRWLVFAGSLPGGGCAFTHYRLPTVVMSRLAEQFDKAKRVLWGNKDAATSDSIAPRMDYRAFCKYISKQLSGIGIVREASEADCHYLATRAGFVPVHEGGKAASTPTQQELAAFKAWFAGHLVMLKHIRPHYERSDVQVVSGFAMTRERAEELLGPQPRGTFLLRFGSQGGLLVLSVRSSGGSSPSKTGSGGSSLVTHYSLSSAALQSSGLEGLLERNGAAEQLLDTTTGQRHMRTAILDRSYLQVVDAAEARKRYRDHTIRGRLDEGESPQLAEPPAQPVPCAPSGLPPSHSSGGLQRIESRDRCDVASLFNRMDSMRSNGSLDRQQRSQLSLQAHSLPLMPPPPGHLSGGGGGMGGSGVVGSGMGGSGVVGSGMGGSGVVGSGMGGSGMGGSGMGGSGMGGGGLQRQHSALGSGGLSHAHTPSWPRCLPGTPLHTSTPPGLMTAQSACLAAVNAGPLPPAMPLWGVPLAPHQAWLGQPQQQQQQQQQMDCGWPSAQRAASPFPVSGSSHGALMEQVLRDSEMAALPAEPRGGLLAAAQLQQQQGSMRPNTALELMSWSSDALGRYVDFQLASELAQQAQQVQQAQQAGSAGSLPPSVTSPASSMAFSDGSPASTGTMDCHSSGTPQQQLRRRASSSRMRRTSQESFAAASGAAAAAAAPPVGAALAADRPPGEGQRLLQQGCLAAQRLAAVPTPFPKSQAELLLPLLGGPAQAADLSGLQHMLKQQLGPGAMAGNSQPTGHLSGSGAALGPPPEGFDPEGLEGLFSNFI